MIKRMTTSEQGKPSRFQSGSEMHYQPIVNAKRLLCSAIFGLTFAISSSIYALGLGSLEVNSNLDQPLRGEIDLRLSVGDDINSVTAVIASREDFERLGIDYPEYLKDINISVDQSSGSPSLLVTSNDVVIKEPFIHFLVRVEWSGGSFLREYTALIDPPLYAAETPRAISQPRVVGDDVVIEQPSQQDEVIEIEPVADYDLEVIEETNDLDSPFTSSSSEFDNQVEEDYTYTEATEDESDYYTETASGSNAKYGPVASGESLSVIAQELQRQFPDLSIYQIMKVLFDENRDAFIDDNINGLIQGAILEIGDLDTIRSTDVAQSKVFFSEQLAAWSPNRFADSADPVSVGNESYNYDNNFGADSAAGSTSSDNFQVGASDESDNLLSSDSGRDRSGEVLALQQEISRLETSLASSALENQELTERISMLEGQLSDMNRLLELGVEDAGLANVENTLAAQNDQATLEESKEVTNPDDSSISEFLSETQEESLDDILADVVSEELGAAESELSDQTLAAADVVEIDGELTPQDDFGDELEPIAEINENQNQAAAATTTNSNQPAGIVVEPSKPFYQGIVDALSGSGFTSVLIGVGALLLGGVALLIVRRRRADEEFEVSMLSIESNSQSVTSVGAYGDTSSASASMTPEAQSVQEGGDKETSFLTVYSDSDAVVQADEVDPVAEADVYIAYGRDEQAEEVLLDGLVSQPNRLDIKQKLLSLYHRTGNAEGFERIAEEVYSNRDELSAEAWQEVIEMGKEVSPDNPLFSLSVIDLENAMEADSEMSVDVDDDSDETAEDLVGLDSVEQETPVEQAVEEANETEAKVIENSTEMIVEALSNDDSIQLIDFDDGRSEMSHLDEVDLDILERASETTSEISEEDVEVDVVETSGSDAGEIEFEAADDVLEFPTIESAVEVQEDDSKKVGEVQEVSDLEIDPEYDEARTQFELAKVFVDLGDNDGAQRILNELVANDDNDSGLINEAQELLDSIS